VSEVVLQLLTVYTVVLHKDYVTHRQQQRQQQRSVAGASSSSSSHCRGSKGQRKAPSSCVQTCCPSLPSTSTQTCCSCCQVARPTWMQQQQM
jgi:hypothetical protein